MRIFEQELEVSKKRSHPFIFSRVPYFYNTPESARQNHGKTASRQSSAAPRISKALEQTSLTHGWTNRALVCRSRCSIVRDKEGSFLGLAYDVRKPFERRPGNPDGLLHPAEGGAARLPLFASSRWRPRHRSSSRTAHPPLFGHSSRPHQNQQRRSRRSRLSHWPAGQGVECLNGCRED